MTAAASDPTTRRGHWLAWPARHPVATCVIAAIALIVCAISISRMRPDASIAGMFPKDDPAATALVRVLDRFSAVEELLGYGLDALDIELLLARLDEAHDVDHP